MNLLRCSRHYIHRAIYSQSCV